MPGKQRLYTVMGAVWILGWAIFLEPWDYSFMHGLQKPFLAIGVGPIALILVILWIQEGFKKDRGN